MLFPEVKFDSHSVKKCAIYKRIYNVILILILILLTDQRWGKIENRRKFFEDYAKEKGFDPLVPHNWYRLPRSDIADIKVLIIIN